MKKLLFVDCNIRKEQSRTQILSNHFLNSLNDKYEITHLNLMGENLQPLYGTFFDEREKLLKENKRDHPRFKYAHQIAEADIVLIAAPFWDLSFPSLLKIYIENCSVDGITFFSDLDGLHGLCKGKLIYLTTRGGNYFNSSWAQDVTYLKALQEFFGFSSFNYVAADEMDIDQPTRNKSLEKAKEDILKLITDISL